MSKLTPKQLSLLRAEPPSERGNRVAKALELAGLTQAQAAEAMGELQPYVSDVARARYATITVTKAQKFADLFGCAIEDLFPRRTEVA